MIGPELADIKLLWPELVLVATALGLILSASRIRKGLRASTVTLVAGFASILVYRWPLAEGPRAGFENMIVVDGYSQFFKVLVSSALILIVLLSARRVETDNVRAGEYYALLLLASVGMMFAVSSTDLIPLYLGLELTTICSYILVGTTVEKRISNEAATKYFLLSAFTSALLLYGIALIYGMAGSTSFEAVASFLSDTEGENSKLILVAIGLIVAGLAFKIAAVPFHSWAPDAYEGASAPIAAFLATASKAAGLAVLGRICISAFAEEAHLLSLILATMATLSIIVGSVIALSQTNMKRLLAYSSISHAGYALLGLLPGTPEGVSATMTYVFVYVFMTLGAFGVVTALGRRGERIDGYEGLARQQPVTALLMLIFLLSLTGIPPTGGFIAKFGVILSALNAGYFALAVLAVACSVISAFVYLRVAVIMYMKAPQVEETSSYPLMVSTALLVSALVTVIGGILPGVLNFWEAVPQ
jgi:NADH-quinone oxidoreductase subunit N